MGIVMDIDGNFLLAKVFIGWYCIEVIYLGYEFYIVEDVIFNFVCELVLEIVLLELVVMVEEVVVIVCSYGNEFFNEFFIVSICFFFVEEIQWYVVSVNDFMCMALGFFGVQGSCDVCNDFIICGNLGFGLFWWVEGIDVFNLNYFVWWGVFGGGILIFSVSVLSNLDFFIGVFLAMYGNVFFGVFDI